MNANPNANPPSEELMTRFLDEALTPEEQQEMERHLHADPSLLMEKQQWQSLRTALQSELPATLEPPSHEFFTSQIMKQIQEESTAAKLEPAKQGWFHWLRSAWLAPLATSAAVLAVGFFVLKNPAGQDGLVTPYSPDPNVKATLVFNEDANATVINLDNLVMEDNQEIKAFNVASADPANPGFAQRFYAANDPGKLLFVILPGDNSAPRIREIQ
jgi:negative regulator of sigma E activity